MNYQFIDNLPTNEFDAFSKNHDLTSIFQISSWASVKKEWKPLFTAVKNDNEIIASGLVLIRKMPLGYTLFYLPRGPLIDFCNQELLLFYFENLKLLAKKHRAIMIKIDPNCLLSITPVKEFLGRESVRNSLIIDNLKALGFKHFGFNEDLYSSSQPRYNAVFYYQNDYEEKLKQSKAYKLYTKAEKKGVYCEFAGVEALDVFSDIMHLTEQRKGVALRNRDYFKSLLDNFEENSVIVLSKLNLKTYNKDLLQSQKELKNQMKNPDIGTRKKEQISSQIDALKHEIEHIHNLRKEDGDIVTLNASLMVKDKHTSNFLYSGLNSKYQKYYGPYFAQFNKIRWSFEQGCLRCDFGGIPGTLDDGLSEYKSSYNPSIDEYIGEFDLPTNKLIYPLFTFLLPQVKKLFKLIAKVKRK